jgi:hypothetical protein
MIGWLVDAVKGLFSGKGVVQLGNNTNSTVTSTTTKNPTFGNGNTGTQINADVVNFQTPQTPPREQSEFKPTPEEIEILRALAEPGAQPVQLVRVDSAVGFVVLVNLKEAANPHADSEGCLRYYEAVQHLSALGLLVNPSGDAQLWMLSRQGRETANALPATQPVQFQVHNAHFRFMGTDAGGGYSATTRARATSVSYWFKLDAFNSGAVDLALMDIRLVFARGAVVLSDSIPTLHTGESRAGATYCPNLTALELPSRKLISIQFQGGDSLAVADCDKIYLVARSTEGRSFQIALGAGICEDK